MTRDGSQVVAVIDVGSNSVRLLVARAWGPTAFEVVDEARVDARLGSGQLPDGDLSPESFERGLRAVRMVVQLARSHAPSSMVVVGTEALRRAGNGPLFRERVQEELGVGLRILTGDEEARAGFLGVVNSTSLADGYVIDIGGGSLELMRAKGRVLRSVESAPLGAIYASERFLMSDPPARREVRALRRAVRASFGDGAPLPMLYGSGGAVRNLARIVRQRKAYPLRRLHGLVVARRELTRLATTLAKMDGHERRRHPGISPNRVDTLPAAAIVIDELMDLLGAESLTVAGQGLREGLVWETLRGPGAVLSDVRTTSVMGMARANGVDEHAEETVVICATDLFDATVPVHKLGEADRELLACAARLAGIGMHIDYYGRDRHAEYLVHSGDLHGFSHREIVLLAAMVRCSESGTPNLSPYASIMEPDDPRRVAVLSALLGTARAVCRRRPSPVHRFEPRLAGRKLRLQLVGGDSLDPELHALDGQIRRLESVLRVEPSVLRVD